MVGAPRSSAPRLISAVALALAVGGVALVGVGLAGPGSPDTAVPGASGVSGAPSQASAVRPTSPPATPSPTTRAAADDVRDRTTGVVLPESDPVSVAIPKIKVRSSLVDLGLDRQGAMEVPADPAQAGWFSRAAAPGALGPAVIAGHVTWNGAPAVFRRLASLKAGDEVSVGRKDGRTAVFTVTDVEQFSKSQFPSRAVYGAIDHAGLRLITCGGAYDAASHRYLDNVVVFAELSAVRGPRR